MSRMSREMMLSIANQTQCKVLVHRSLYEGSSPTPKSKLLSVSSGGGGLRKPRLAREVMTRTAREGSPLEELIAQSRDCKALIILRIQSSFPSQSHDWFSGESHIWAT